MPWYKRLRWRLIGSQFLVALVGVSIMMLATRIIILNSAPVVIRPLLKTLLDNPDSILQTEADLIIAFRNAVLFSVLFAALGAIAAGVFSSVLLWGTIINPLRQVADSSQRIADGLDLIIGNVVHQHGIGPIAEFVVTHDDTETLDDPLVDQFPDHADHITLADTDLACDRCVGPRDQR